MGRQPRRKESKIVSTQDNHPSGKAFDQLAEATSAAIFIVQDGQVIYTNPAASLITGYSITELTGMEFFQLAHPTYQDVIRSHGLAQHWDPSIPMRYELKIVTKSGEERWVDLTSGLLEFNGQPAQVITGFDITERDLAEQELRKAKAELEVKVAERTAELDRAWKRLDAIFQSMAEAVVVYSAEGRLEWANPKAIQTYGYDPVGITRDENISRLKIVDPFDRVLTPEQVPSTRALRGEIVVSEPLFITNPHGQTFATLSSAAPVYMNGEISGAVVVWHDISEQERLERENRQKGKLLQLIFETYPGGIAVLVGRDFIFRYANPAYTNLTPQPEKDPIGSKLEDIWTPVEGFSGRKLLEEVLETGQPYSNDRYKRPLPDGTERYYHFHLWPLDWDGEPAVLVAVWDVTRVEYANILIQAAADEARRRAEELDATFNAIADGVMIYDEDGIPVKANPAVVRIYGFDPVRQDPYQIIHQLKPRTLQGKEISLNEMPSMRALRGELVSNDRFKFINSAGKDLTIVASAAPLIIDGQIKGAVAVWHDVTDREELLERLDIEQAKLEAVINSAPEAIVVVDHNSQVIITNPAAHRLFAPRREEPGKVRQFEERLSYADGTACKARNLPLTRSALDGEVHTEVELALDWSNTTRRFLLASSSPIYDHNGHLSGAVGIFQDITQRKITEEEMRRSAAFSRVLASLSKAFAEAGLDLPAVLETINREIVDSLGDACLIRLVSEDRQWLEPVTLSLPHPEAYPPVSELLVGMRRRVTEGLVGKVFTRGEPLLIPFLPVTEGRRMAELEKWPWSEKYPIRSMLIVPLRARGTIIGTLGVFRTQALNPYAAEDQLFFQDLANRAALAIDNARLYESETHRSRELDALHSATAALLSTLDLETMLGEILQAALRAIPAAERGALHLITPETGILDVRAVNGMEEQGQEIEFLQKSDSYPAQAVRTRKPILIEDLLHADHPGELPPGERPGTVRAAMAAPLMFGDQVLGALSLDSSEPGAFSGSDLRLLLSFAMTTTTAIQNATLHSEVQRQAITDAITGLFNRRGFNELGRREVDRIHRFEHPLVAIMLDIDHFKKVNDTYTHSVGDQILKGLADRLRLNLRDVDIIGRYGGEEFSILLPETELETGKHVAERLRECVEEAPFPTSHGLLKVTISIGLAEASDDSFDLDALLHAADVALYSAKQNGRNQVVVFAQGL